MMACLEVQTDCAAVGAFPVGAEGQLASQFTVPVTDRNLKISVLLPKGTERVDFRSASQLSLPGYFRVKKVDYVAFDDLRDMNEAPLTAMFESNRKFIFMHSAGKTGSTTLLNEISSLQDIVAMRMHFVNLPVAPSWLLRSLTLEHLISARIVMSALKQASTKPDLMDVITGVRRSELQFVAALFQNFGDVFITLGMSVDEVLRFIYDTARRPDGYTTWWEDDFFPTHGFTVDGLKQGIRQDGLTWTFLAPNGRLHRFLRIEDGSDVLSETLEHYACYAERPDQFPGAVRPVNLAADKSYATLYSAVKEQLDLDLLQSLRPPTLRAIDALFYG